MPKPRARKFRFNENPYVQFDGSLNPRWVIWEVYGETASNTEDERLYSNGLIRLLTTKGRVLETYRSIEREMERDDDMSGLPMSTFYGDGGTSLYLYKDNLVRAREDDEGTVTIDLYYPVSKSCVIKDFERFLVEEKGESRVSVLVSRGGSLVAQKVTFAPPVIEDLELNYGTGFKKVHEAIVGKLEAKCAKLFILSGCPGSGKSTYIKHLSSIINREFIFIPVNTADKLGSPDFISLLVNKKEAVLILEDAEQAVQQRGTGGDDSAVATLLNISDGILGSLLNISIIVTFNAERHTMDKALLRKGRLAYDYDFGPLKVEDAKRLASKLGKSTDITQPTTLADIYGAGDNTGLPPPAQDSRAMGFHTLITNLATPKPDPAQKKDAVAEKG